MKKTKRKMVKRKKVNKRRTVKSKGGKQSKTVTVYAWPKEKPDASSNKPNKMMYMIDVTNNNGYKSKIYESVEDADEWAEYMTNGNPVVPIDVKVQTKSLVVGKN